MKSPKTSTIQTSPPTECVSTLVGSRTPAADYKLIPLTQGKYAKVDPEYYDWIRRYNWYAHKGGDTFYAWTNISIKGKQKKVMMHRLILGAKDGEEIDHRNHDGVDNRLCNIRKCTQSQNCQNRKPYKNSLSKYKGVSWNTQHKKWRVTVIKNKKQYHVGLFDSEIKAAKAYDAKALELFGEFACTNF